MQLCEMEVWFMDKIKSASSLSSAAFVLAVLSVFSCMIIYLCVPLAALSVILALLSRGTRKIGGRTGFTLVLAAAAMTISIALTSFAAYRIYHTPALRAQFERLLDYAFYQGDPIQNYLSGSGQTAGEPSGYPGGNISSERPSASVSGTYEGDFI